MSWQAYVDTSLVGSGNIDKAAIFNKEGTSLWAGTAGFKVTPEELKEIVAAYADTGDIKKCQSTGLHIAGVKYVVIRAVDRSIYGKSGQTTVFIVQTNKAILIAHQPEGVIAGAGASTVESLADYLISVDY